MACMEAKISEALQAQSVRVQVRQEEGLYQHAGLSAMLQSAW